MTDKRFTLRDFIDAIRKNGLKQNKGHLFAYSLETVPFAVTNYGKFIPSDGVITGACAFGQGLINLGIDRPDGIGISSSLMGSFYDRVWRLNDYEDRTPEEIANMLEEEFGVYLDREFLAEEFDYTPLLKEKINV